MEIFDLSPTEADAAATLWEETGLVRAWNHPHADITAALACPTSTILAARDGARIIGTVMAGYDGHRGWLYYVAVAKDRQGTGLGRALVNAGEQWLADQGARVIRLMVRMKMTRSPASTKRWGTRTAICGSWASDSEGTGIPNYSPSACLELRRRELP